MTHAERSDYLSPAVMARLPLLSRLAFDLAIVIAKWQLRSTTRRSLRSLEAHMLRDIGLEASDAHNECTKRFWQE